DIASFKVASRNTSEASSLLQVAEGGMDQIGNMLTRLKELATQAASANVGSSERTKIDAEADQLITEIDRIANSTKYGSTDLLDGTFGASKSGALNAGDKGEGIVNDNIIYNFTANTTMTGPISDAVDGQWKFIATGFTGTGTLKIQNSAGTLVETATIDTATGTIATFAELGMTITFTAAISNAVNCATVDFYRTGLTNVSAEGADAGTYTITDASGTDITLANSAGTISQTVDVSAGGTANFDQLGISFDVGANYDDQDLNGAKLVISATGSAGNTFQIGAKNNSNNQIAISIDGVRTSDLNIDSIDLSTASNAQSALDSIDSAISTLAGSRGDIGAYMNRLAYASANLATTIENTQAAESVIRDVDMASEMTQFTKNQILLQAGTAMLAQANMSPQQVLALFG
ncbi:MAG: hypothetical protein JRI26_11590, partial [Deltaproteobacteria bacterium]|nr:hypothetical protein [Deltaproteobacteria bacterium]